MCEVAGAVLSPRPCHDGDGGTDGSAGGFSDGLGGHRGGPGPAQRLAPGGRSDAEATAEEGWPLACKE